MEVFIISLSVVHNLGVMRHVYHVSTGDWRLRVSGANVANTGTPHSLSRDIGPVATAPLSTLRQNNINQTTTPDQSKIITGTNSK